MQLLKIQFPNITGLCDPALLYNPDYKPKLKHGETIFVFNTTALTSTHFGTHWIVISDVLCNSNCWRIYDSGNTRLQGNENIQTFMKKLYSERNTDILTIEVPSVQVQPNGYDCGVFALAFVRTLVENVDPCVMHYKQTEMREHYNNSMRDGNLQISPFPFFPRKKCARSEFYEFLIKLK